MSIAITITSYVSGEQIAAELASNAEETADILSELAERAKERFYNEVADHIADYQTDIVAKTVKFLRELADAIEAAA